MNSTPDWVAAVIKNRQPLTPLPTDIEPYLQPLADIRAVLFDVYGTLLISGSGDVGTVATKDCGQDIREALSAAGWRPLPDSLPTLADLHGQISLASKNRLAESCPKPEIDIVDVWRKTLAEINCPLPSDIALASEAVVRLAAEYESRSNPTWPMPGAAEVCDHLAKARVKLGIISNAQVFTPPLVENLLGRTMAEADFDLDLCLFSNRFGQAKPGPRLFQVAVAALRHHEIQPSQAIYVGNDMLNDVWAAKEAGFKTAWFVGDRRSCRRRLDDPRCQALHPDLVITELTQLASCLGGSDLQLRLTKHWRP